MDIDNLLSHSSAVEGLEMDGGKLRIFFYPHRQILPQNTRVILTGEIYARGSFPRFCNSGNDIFFFADEAHRQECLRQWGFSWEWIYKNLLPEQPLAQVIELFPKKEEKIDETQSVAL
ncbi:MAG: hypothetical protein NTX00_02675 [Candidatus Parcubacteria bacterium]|nr:hypothetical protein [Candidatus Parcubacteria bacterium]